MKDKVVIVTGAGSGIGLAASRRFADDGAKVTMVDIADCSGRVRAIREDGGDALSVEADVSRAGDVDAMVERTLAAFGRIDALVNNAATVVFGRVDETSEANWDRLFDVNLKSVFLCSRTVIPVMREQGGGAIVNVGSEFALIGGPQVAAYCASKGGVVQLTRAIAADHAADGIRVNAVCPGPTATPMLESEFAAAEDGDAQRQAEIERTMLKRFGTPVEIANVIRFIASDEASNMTGAVVAVDGGITAQ